MNNFAELGFAGRFVAVAARTATVLPMKSTSNFLSASKAPSVPNNHA
jgi:hypothetical protein